MAVWLCQVYVEVRSEVTFENLQICEYFFFLEPKDIFFSSESPDFVTIASGKLSAISRGAGDLPTPSELRDRSIWVRGDKGNLNIPLVNPKRIISIY